jgi:hypothetical protein
MTTTYHLVARAERGVALLPVTGVAGGAAAAAGVAGGLILGPGVGPPPATGGVTGAKPPPPVCPAGVGAVTAGAPASGRGFQRIPGTEAGGAGVPVPWPGRVTAP